MLFLESLTCIPQWNRQPQRLAGHQIRRNQDGRATTALLANAEYVLESRRRTRGEKDFSFRC